MKFSVKMKMLKTRSFRTLRRSTRQRFTSASVSCCFRSLQAPSGTVFNYRLTNTIILNVLLTYFTISISETRYSTHLDLNLLMGHLLVFQIFDTILGFLKLVRQFLELLED